MSDPKPSDLNAEERAIVRDLALMYYVSQSHLSVEQCCNAALRAWSDMKNFGHALFAPAKEDGKVVYLCPHCGVATDGPTHLRKLEYGAEWICNRKCSNCLAPSGDHDLCQRCESILEDKPAQPSPVAPPSEMPGAVGHAIHKMRLQADDDERRGYTTTPKHWRENADALESWWRSQPAPAREKEI